MDKNTKLFLGVAVTALVIYVYWKRNDRPATA